MKGIYYADPTTYQFTHSDIVADDYVLQENETFENPTGKLEPAKLVGTSWQDATEPEHTAWVQAQQVNRPPVKPSTQQQMIAHLGQQVQQQQQMIAHLGQQLSAQGGTTND